MLLQTVTSFCSMICSGFLLYSGFPNAEANKWVSWALIILRTADHYILNQIWRKMIKNEPQCEVIRFRTQSEWAGVSSHNVLTWNSGVYSSSCRSRPPLSRPETIPSRLLRFPHFGIPVSLQMPWGRPGKPSRQNQAPQRRKDQSRILVGLSGETSF